MWNEFVTMVREWSLLSLVIRMTMALAVGILIGINRSVKHRGAGIKTHTLVCLGACIVMATGQYLYRYFPAQADIGRLGAQVVSGVGFLGVGTIIVTGKNQVRGLTTAAGLWACACIGLAAGIGFVEGVIICLILVLFTYSFLDQLDTSLRRRSRNLDFYLEFEDNRSVSSFIEAIKERGWKLEILELSRGKGQEEGPSAVVTIEVKERKMRPVLAGMLRQLSGIRFVEEL